MSLPRTAAVTLGFGLALAGAGCKPDLGAPQSFVDGPRVLAVRASPPEARPADAPISFDTLLVDVDGRVAAPPLGWAICNEPHPPAESNVVSSACLELPDTSTAETFTAPLPAEACTNFGPLTSKPGARPADPDTTGGYYQPVRASWHPSRNPQSGSEPPAMGSVEQSSTSPDANAGLTAFALPRILCPLGAIAPTDVAGAYANDYRPNVNPTLSAVVVDPDGAEAPLYEAGDTVFAPASVGAGQLITFEARWDAAVQETFKVYDLTTHLLADQTESLRLSWFATAGEFEHERTGRTAAETDTPFSRNIWRAPAAPGLVHLFVVLRDSRSGVDFATAQVEVTP
jgi:hypothetical protein